MMVCTHVTDTSYQQVMQAVYSIADGWKDNHSL